MNPLLEQFVLEARENLAFIDQNIEQIGDDPEILNAVFRAAHTLKGGSGIVGFEAVKTITHYAEDLLDMLRSKQITFHESMIETLYNAFDEVMNLIEAAEENGDIVDVDEERIDAIAADLSALMGKDHKEIKEWKIPFSVISDIVSVINRPMPFMSSLSETLPFHITAIDEQTCLSPQLYAIVFDIDESCMLYGNDPLYALSLLGNSVIAIHSCLSEENSESILSGLDDPEGLGLKVQIIAFVQDTFETINDALFNFSDELTYYPLDIVTLLSVTTGQWNHTLDILKELYREIIPSARAGDRAAIADKVIKSLQLIGRDTLQYAQLKRLGHLIEAISTNDLPLLESFLSVLPRGEVYHHDPDTMPPIIAEDETNQDRLVPPVLVLDEALEEQMAALLKQQLMALESVEEEKVYMRVEGLLNLYIRPFIPSMPPSFVNRNGMIDWIRSYLAVPVPSEEINSEILGPITAAPLSIAVQHTESSLLATPRESSEVQNSSVKKSIIGKTVKIDQESIDHLMNIVGELLVAKNSLPYLADGVHSMNSEKIKLAIMDKYTFINRLAEQLQDMIMSMRMLPISYVFDRYPKLVRDISKNLGKKVTLTMEGGETKLDKNMIEMLADPMIHIMRNSLDHGIESPEIREQKGKNPEGLISLNAYAQSDKIIIEIKDDGAGINIDRVVQKVLENNLLTLDQIDLLSDDEKASLVMLPGLSTAETISEYSGRGVGMDVVKKSIENFGGTIRIKTLANRGTTITLSIPVSLAVSSLLHVTMSDIHYGFPMDSVSETVKIESSQIEYLHNEPFVYIRGEVIPLLFIKPMLDETVLAGKALPIVVLNVKGNLVAVVVNELLGQLDVVQKPLEGVMENHPIFSGTALLGNGQIIMTIDPFGLLQTSHLLTSEMG